MLTDKEQVVVIELFPNMSKNPNGIQTPQGSTNYYPNVIFNQSQFIYWTDHLSFGSNWGTDFVSGTDYTMVSGVDVSTLTGGTDDCDKQLMVRLFTRHMISSMIQNH